MGTASLSKRTIQKIIAVANAAEQDTESKIEFSVSYALLRSAEKLKSAGRVISKERLKFLGPEYGQKIKAIQDEMNNAAARLEDKKDADKIAVINNEANKKAQALDVEFKPQIEALNEYFDTVDEVEIYQCKIKSLEALNDVPNYIRPALVHLVIVEDSGEEKTDL